MDDLKAYEDLCLQLIKDGLLISQDDRRININLLVQVAIDKDLGGAEFTVVAYLNGLTHGAARMLKKIVDGEIDLKTIEIGGTPMDE